MSEVSVHSAIIKVGTTESTAQIVIECAQCGRMEFTLPVRHLTTLANAAAAAAARLGLNGITEVVASVEGTEGDVDATLNARRAKAHLN